MGITMGRLGATNNVRTKALKMTRNAVVIIQTLLLLRAGGSDQRGRSMRRSMHDVN